jgi:hypothetical protein
VAATRVAVEIGSKRAFASALDWPGWCRSGRNEQAALEALAGYAKRYAAVPEAAGITFVKRASADFDVVERVRGGATTDFGAPEMHAALEQKPVTRAEVDRMCALVAACWMVFDRAVEQAPPSLRKGPRGGGRDRDKIVDHVLGAECGYAPKLGLKLRQPALGDAVAIAAHRKALLEAVRAGAGGKPMRERGWTARYAARRIAWHAMDHAWEIEDRSGPRTG